jgi:hypothetical protein
MLDQETRSPYLRRLSFSNDYINAFWVREARDYRIQGRAVVVNIHSADADIVDIVNDVSGEPTPVKAHFPLRPWQSAIIEDGVFARAGSLIVIQVIQQKNIGSVMVDPHWRLFGTSVPDGSAFPRDTPLWISPHDDLGRVEVDLSHVGGAAVRRGETEPMDLKVNLWYAPPQTDCFIHTGHQFLEIHTQIHGSGRMQKFREASENTLCHEFVMSPGSTHPPFFVVTSDRDALYPWHRYYADTDCIWMAMELYRPEARPLHGDPELTELHSRE